MDDRRNAERSGALKSTEARSGLRVRELLNPFLRLRALFWGHTFHSLFESFAHSLALFGRHGTGIEIPPITSISPSTVLASPPFIALAGGPIAISSTRSAPLAPR